MNGWVLVWAAMAGGVGAGLRHLVDVLVASAGRGRLPFGILIVNVSGSFALGVLTGWGVHVVGEVVWIAGVGLLGGYTTFSTVSLDSVLAMEAGQRRRGWLNSLATLILGVVAAAIGLALGSLL